MSKSWDSSQNLEKKNLVCMSDFSFRILTWICRFWFWSQNFYFKFRILRWTSEMNLKILKIVRILRLVLILILKSEIKVKILRQSLEFWVIVRILRKNMIFSIGPTVLPYRRLSRFAFVELGNPPVDVSRCERFHRAAFFTVAPVAPANLRRWRTSHPLMASHRWPPHRAADSDSGLRRRMRSERFRDA